MKKALFLTDGSVDTALSLNHWLNVQTEPFLLTVVYAFTVDQPLKVSVYRDTRQTASDELVQWLNFLPSSLSGQSGPVQLQAEVLLGEPALVLTTYLLLRQYDYLLITSGQTDVSCTFLNCQSQIRTQLRNLSTEPTHPHQSIRHSGSDVGFATVSAD